LPRACPQSCCDTHHHAGERVLRLPRRIGAHWRWEHYGLRAALLSFGGGRLGSGDGITARHAADGERFEVNLWWKLKPAVQLDNPAEVMVRGGGGRGGGGDGPMSIGATE